MKYLNSIQRSRESLLKVLGVCRDAHSVAQLHSLLLRTGLLAAPDCFFATRLTASYSYIAHLESARKLFDEIPHPNIFLWNAILRAHSRAHQWPETLRLFYRMCGSPMPQHRPDSFTLPIALKACAAMSALGAGKAVHGLVIKTHRACSDMFVGAALVGLYAKFGDMGDALRVFEGFPEPDVVLRTSMVSGYQQNGEADMAVSFFSRMFAEKSLTPDPVTLVSMVSALGQLGDLRSGKSCHGFVIRMGLESDLSLMNSILHLYAKLGVVRIAKRLFEVMPRRDVVTWSCMVACYAQNGRPIEALNVYGKMNDVGLEPNSVTLISALQACALALDLEEGTRVHEIVIQKGLESELAVSTALIDMYMKCSSYNEAMDIFNQMAKKDVVSWAAIIGGYAQNGLANESLRVFKYMLLDGSVPDAVTMVKVLGACSQLGIQHQAVCFHGYLVTSGFENKVFVGAALVDLYSKCGNLDSAVRVFESMDEKDVVLWSSMIAGYGIHGLGSRAIATFEHMIESSVRPNNVIFVSILSACSHAGLVEEGRRIFDSMFNVYGVLPDSEHYAIMVDLLGRAGELHEAVMLMERIPKPLGPDVWCALLAGCRIHQNIEMGKLAARNLLELEPNHAGYYNLLSNMYAFDGKWDNVIEVRTVMEERRLRKTPGYSAVQVGNEVHTFLAGERLQEWERICELLKELSVKMREEGYVHLEKGGLVDCQMEEEFLVEACL